MWHTAAESLYGGPERPLCDVLMILSWSYIELESPGC